MQTPNITDFRTALAQLIITKDSLNAAMTQLVQEIDTAAQYLDKISSDLAKAKEETDADNTNP
jgi:hypothetical protein